MDLTAEDAIALRRAKSLLEHQGLAVRIANAVGTPVEKLFASLPAGASQLIQAATTKSLHAAVRTVVGRMHDGPQGPSAWRHTVAVAATGAVGGAFGLASLAAELPVSTAIMLRSIADIARGEGQSLQSPDVQIACVEVFAMGGPRRGDDAVESGYFAVRAALARAVAEAAAYVAQRGVVLETAPALIRVTTQVAARFGVPVTEKVMAQSVPIVGAAGGAMVNVMFIRHFQDVARGHFCVRRLEAKYGPDVVRSAYLAI